jgi:hypothetical protein
MTERDERAFREALEALGPDEPVDPESARQRGSERRRNRRAFAGVAVALVLVAGVVGLPRVFPAGQADPTAAGGAAAESAPTAVSAPQESAPQDSAPDDRTRDRWRTEYYRDISFRVPADWGYAVPPQSDWCSHEPRGEPRTEQRRPYVWLGADIPVNAIACPAMPTSLLTEHVEALSPGDYIEGVVKSGEWWVVTRFAGSAVLVVTTKEAALAEQILDSAQVKPEDAPCEPSSPVAGPIGARPDQSAGLADLGPVDRVALCQYEPVEDSSDAALPRLRAVRQLTGQDAQALVDDLTAAPVNDSRCDPEPIDRAPQLAVLVRIWVRGELHQVFVNPSGCPDGDSGMYGGIDDGVLIRLLTEPVCRALLKPPVQLVSGASSDVARNCLG